MRPPNSPEKTVASDPTGVRPRAKISSEQLAVLVAAFEREPLPNLDQRQELAKVLGMTPRSVQIWFQNRRQRLKPQQQSTVRQQHPQSFGMPRLAAVAGLYGGHDLPMPPMHLPHMMTSMETLETGEMTTYLPYVSPTGSTAQMMPYPYGGATGGATPCKAGPPAEQNGLLLLLACASGS